MATGLYLNLGGECSLHSGFCVHTLNASTEKSWTARDAVSLNFSSDLQSGLKFH